MHKKVRHCLLICGTGWLLPLLTGCMGAAGGVSANEAFALSASALSGSENYGFAGKLAVYSPGGKVEKSASFKGEVSLHGNLKLNWTEPDKASGVLDEKERIAPGYKPLSLLEALNGRNASIAYATAPAPGEPVRIRIQLREETAKQRIADALRKELAEVGADERLYVQHPEQARKTLKASERRLEAALATLKVDTVVLWTANSKSWFPERMVEETELLYEWEGKTYSERRTSETNFLAAAKVVQ